ncbi:AI-2E family transporter [Novosphingobium sp. G106]|uniref:AI-2E family transporter n=1 Tax=Novosphingobium sp. G106 TaxID=2849500 RepID=UPI001C2D07ED|nr:AI-2E family transporter [Novosphingobium sp. G106]MBV1691434.1 AI-2E family transporter [Novosphingobium sp. G106]
MLTIATLILVVAALRASYSVSMPLLFAAVIVAALWPLKLWLDRRLPSWLSYVLTIAALVIILTIFAAAVYLSVGQLLGVLSAQWPKIAELYDLAIDRAREWGIKTGAGFLDQRRVFGFAQALASSVYSFVTYAGFIGLLVILGMPEVARLNAKIEVELEPHVGTAVRGAMVSISEQVRRYFGTTLATSLMTGIASTLWALATGLEMPIVWGLLNFLLNFIPVIGNIIGIVPPGPIRCLTV